MSVRSPEDGMVRGVRTECSVDPSSDMGPCCIRMRQVGMRYALTFLCMCIRESDNDWNFRP